MVSLRSLGLLRAGAALGVISIVAACSGGTPTTAPTGTAGAPATAAFTAAPPTTTATEVPPDQLTGSLDVFDWAGYEVPDFSADFIAKYPKVKLNFGNMGSSDADIYNQMSTGVRHPDVFHPYTGWLNFYVEHNMVQEIDTSKLANWSKVPDKFKALGQINGKQYFVPWDWGFSSVLYRTDKIPTVDTWGVLTDPKYDGHIMMWDDGPGAVTVSSYIHGWDETQTTPDQLAQSKEEWTRVLCANPTPWAYETDLVNGVTNSDVWAAYSWQGAYATLLGQGAKVAYADPKEKRNSWVGMYGITTETKSYDLALKFIDEKLGDKTGEALVNQYYYGTANQDVMKAITDETLKTAFSIDDPSILDSTKFTPILTDQQKDDWIKMWTDAKADAAVRAAAGNCSSS
jgi:spermidine/putrescine transport system substrate-binding protein